MRGQQTRRPNISDQVDVGSLAIGKPEQIRTRLRPIIEIRASFVRWGEVDSPLTVIYSGPIWIRKIRHAAAATLAAGAK